jgi:hypothetical protein
MLALTRLLVDVRNSAAIITVMQCHKDSYLLLLLLPSTYRRFRAILGLQLY